MVKQERLLIVQGETKMKKSLLALFTVFVALMAINSSSSAKATTTQDLTSPTSENYLVAVWPKNYLYGTWVVECRHQRWIRIRCVPQ
jgi:hypothetical protein